MREGKRWINLVSLSLSLSLFLSLSSMGQKSEQRELSFPSLPSPFSQSFFSLSFFLSPTFFREKGGKEEKLRGTARTGEGSPLLLVLGGGDRAADLDNVTLAIVRDSFIYLPPLLPSPSYRSTMFLSPFLASALFLQCAIRRRRRRRTERPNVTVQPSHYCAVCHPRP